MEGVIVIIFLLIIAEILAFFLLHLYVLLDRNLKKAMSFAKDYPDSIKIIMHMMDASIIWLIVMIGTPVIIFLICIIFK